MAVQQALIARLHEHIATGASSMHMGSEHLAQCIRLGVARLYHVACSPGTPAAAI
jgi:hypothetical protein